VTVLHVLVLVIGVILAIAASDLLGHRGIGAWPVGLLALALALLSGLLYNPWLAAGSLGMAAGAGSMMLAVRIREISKERRIVREAHERQNAQRDRQLERKK
jgi:hypothetical protein